MSAVSSPSPVPARAPAAEPAVPRPRVMRAYRCACGRPVFFRNTACLACGRALGYDPRVGDLRAIEPEDGEPGADIATAVGGVWRDAVDASVRVRRCGRLGMASRCNWLLDADEPAPLAADDGTPLCRCCRQLGAVADLGDAQTAAWFHAVETARRRLVSSLIGLGLPVASRIGEDPDRGLAFDLLRAAPGAATVVTGHADGLITIDLAEADDATREQRRATLHEPYRTLLGHLRHESGHYYQQRLVDGGPWVDACRHRFGDERADYPQALKRHYDEGPPADWAQRHVSAYASAHPWEDWAETWAHYLHLADTLDTARSFGLDGSRVALDVEPFGADDLRDDSEPGLPADEATLHGFAQWLRNAMELTGVLNELSRSLGVADPYPFALSLEAARKLLLVHRIVGASRPTS